MNFFEAQDRSKSATTKLICLFFLTVVVVVFAIYFVISIIKIFSFTDYMESGSGEYHFFDLQLFLITAGITIAVIALSSIYKITMLARGGGSYLADEMGGRLVNPSTTDPDERKLMNIIEEMSIASGVPVPQVYILENESAINAFAAGYTPNDAVVGVTKGCIRILNRDELQGVIAHEFSHILNGDMRLNIRLIGFLYGILILAIIGSGMIRSNMGGRHYRSSSSSQKSGGQIVILGIALCIIGYIGELFGKLIQRAVSRQREYLADASSIQFTRNPSGIAGALKKIGGFSAGSRVRSPHAKEASHMFFGNALDSIFATHPPLDERIRRIEPSFDGEYPKIKIGETSAGAALSPPAGGMAGMTGQSAGDLSLSSKEVNEQAGTVTPEHVNLSITMLSAIPPVIKNELSDIMGSMSVVCALLLDKDENERKIQFATLEKSADKEIISTMHKLEDKILEIDLRLKLPLLDLAIPILRMMAPGQYAQLRNYIQILVESDGKLSLNEFALQQVVAGRLGATFNHAQRKTVYKNIEPLLPDLSNLLSKQAHAGHNNEAEAEKAFNLAIGELPVNKQRLQFLPDNKISFPAVASAINRLSASAPNVKRVVFSACTACALADKTVTIEEAELLRALAYSLDIPLPPFLPKAE
ncbi:MAG: M48 family metallopeptidase [Desulfobacterales bacterium]|nr:M48 family metallopeptidase [Desulfobacterales bacterium]